MSEKDKKVEVKVATNEPVAVQDKPEFSKEELLKIFDEIMFEGEYQEQIVIRNKLKVTFKTRSAEEISEITKELDSKTYNLMASVNEQRAFLNLAYSITNYNGKDISAMKMEDRRIFVGKLPGVVVGALSEALVKFDRKTGAAFQEGEENF